MLNFVRSEDLSPGIFIKGLLVWKPSYKVNNYLNYHLMKFLLRYISHYYLPNLNTDLIVKQLTWRTVISLLSPRAKRVDASLTAGDIARKMHNVNRSTIDTNIRSWKIIKCRSLPYLKWTIVYVLLIFFITMKISD